MLTFNDLIARSSLLALIFWATNVDNAAPNAEAGNIANASNLLQIPIAAEAFTPNVLTTAVIKINEIDMIAS
ncbi:hypothetical protein SDC9_145580 [bioreactor metagenome]|uniref:Uncharacterized protein n=1 Tax=bioreactor metagenome TaxID=1076179 RepID=A0A645E8T9_9ZZZZ